MAGLNKVILMGRLTAEPSLRETASGTAVANFSIAMDRGYGEEKVADFIPVVAWKGTAETIAKYFTKGSQILICGSIQTRSYEDKDGNKRYAFEVVVSEFAFCDSKKTTESNSLVEVKLGSQPEIKPRSRQSELIPINDDDGLPF